MTAAYISLMVTCSTIIASRAALAVYSTFFLLGGK